MSILITGGLGFIGSHAVLEFSKKEEVVIVDDLSNAELTTLNHLRTLTAKNISFYQIDIKDKTKLKKVFEKHAFSGITHFAGYKAVEESVLNPLKYYENNIQTTINLANLALEYQVEKFIFSSSATVYGDQKTPFKETTPLKETANPYGETKKINERILTDLAAVNDNFNVVLLRYFNPIGADKSGLIGERPKGVPNNLMPYLTQTAKGLRKKLFIYGNDYPTVDGTGMRDYIHVTDLAIGHLKAYQYNFKGVEIFNLGTGKATSVLELVAAFERQNKINIPYQIKPRRAGDVAISYADVSKAEKLLKFKTQLSIDEMVKDAWNFEKNLPK